MDRRKIAKFFIKHFKFGKKSQCNLVNKHRSNFTDYFQFVICCQRLHLVQKTFCTIIVCFNTVTTICNMYLNEYNMRQQKIIFYQKLPGWRSILSLDFQVDNASARHQSTTGGITDTALHNRRSSVPRRYDKNLTEVTFSKCLRTFKTKLYSFVFLIFSTVDCKVTAVP